MVGGLLVVEATMNKGHLGPVIERLDLDRQHGLGTVSSPLACEPGQFGASIWFECQEAPVVGMPAPLEVDDEEQLALRDRISQQSAR